MPLYAIIESGRVADFVAPPDGVALSALSHVSAAQKAAAVPVPPGPKPRVGWTYAKGAFAPPVKPPPLTLAHRASALLRAGLPVVSKSVPELSGTYAADAGARADMQDETLALALTGAFVSGDATLAWPDVAGADHTFTAGQWKTFFAAFTAAAAALRRTARTEEGEMPPMPVVIP